MRFTESTPPKHDEFEEICASASLGKATAEDLARLERHVLVCSSCRQAYHNYVSAAACEFAAVVQDPKLTPREAKESLYSDLFMQRWFDRAEREGLWFSEEARRQERSPAKACFLFFIDLAVETICHAFSCGGARGVVPVHWLSILEKPLEQHVARSGIRKCLVGEDRESR